MRKDEKREHIYILPGQEDIFSWLDSASEPEKMRQEIILEETECISAPVAPIDDDLSFMLDGDTQLSFIDNDEWWREHWCGMPEYITGYVGPWKSISIHFRNREDMLEFADLIQQRMTNDTRSVWYPMKPNRDAISMGWVDDEAMRW